MLDLDGTLDLGYNPGSIIRDWERLSMCLGTLMESSTQEGSVRRTRPSERQYREQLLEVLPNMRYERLQGITASGCGSPRRFPFVGVRFP